ncbi:MAG: hypothetical protein J0M07_13120 [Anaerolineae bacterium]|nr:hypothetical protein [Anaerolineae bacterium]
MNLTALLIALPLASSPLIYLASRARISARAAERTSWWLSLGVLLILWGLWVRAALVLAADETLSVTFGLLALRVDGLSVFFALVVLGVSTLVLVSSSAETAEGSEKYFAALLTTTGALIGMVCARDLFNLWVWLETVVISSFLLIALERDRPLALDAGIKYLTQSAVGSILIVLGIALVLAQTGSLTLDSAQSGRLAPGLLAAGVLLIVGFGIKSALVPLHTWLPDVYANAPTRVTALLSGAVTVSGLIVLMRALLPLVSAAETWGLLLIGAGVVNTLLGNLLAFRQTDIKRLLAYSSISHIGTILLGFGVSLYANLPQAAQAGLFHLFTLGLMETLAFLCLATLPNNRHITLADLRGLIYRAPLVGVGLLLALLSLAGLPPLAGFMSKWQVFAAAFISPDPIVRGAVVVIALNILLALGYYLPPLLTLFAGEQPPSKRPEKRSPLTVRLPLIVLSALIVLIGVLPDSVRWLTELASAVLVLGGAP